MRKITRICYDWKDRKREREFSIPKQYDCLYGKLRKSPCYEIIRTNKEVLMKDTQEQHKKK